MVQMLRDDGARVWQSLNAAPIRQADGAVKGAVLLSLDITHRQTLNEQLAERTAELETVLAAAPVAIRRYDAEGRLLFMNQRAQDSAGRIPAEHEGGPFTRLGVRPGATDERGRPPRPSNCPPTERCEAKPCRALFSATLGPRHWPT